MRGDEERAVSPVVAIVLLVGLVALGSVGILLVGSSINDDARQEVETQRVGEAFLELGEEVNTVSRTGEDVRVVDLDLPDDGDSAVRERRDGRLWVNRTDLENGSSETLVDRRIGSVRYEGEEAVFAYQAGAVFRGSQNGTQLLSSPTFEYAVNESGGSPTLTVPVVTTVGPETLPNGEVRVEKVDTETPVNDETTIEGALVRLRVKSEWYVGWAEYFRALAARTGTAQSAVEVDHDDRTATLTLYAPESRTALKGIVSGSTTGNVTFQNRVAISSYNSSQCPYAGGCGATRSDGDVYVSGNLTLKSKAHVNGSVFVGGTLLTTNNNRRECSGSSNEAVICGDATYGTFINDNSGNKVDDKSEIVNGSLDSPASVPTYKDVDALIDATVTDAVSDNDNGDVAAINGNSLASCTSPCTLDSGRYYLSGITKNDLKGKTLRLNTSEGPIKIAVDGPALFDDAVLNVTGGGRVNVYVDSDRSGSCDTSGGGSGCDFLWDKSDSRVRNDSGTITDDASNFWVYMDSSSDATFVTAAGAGGSPPEFTGVLFGPGNGTAPGVNVSVGQGNVVQGTIVGNISFVGQSVEIRYDRRLRQSTVIAENVKVPRITYLVVTNYVVEVEDD